MKVNELIKYVLVLFIALLVGVGTALTAKGEATAENGWAVALICAACIFALAEVVSKTMEQRPFKWKGVLLGVVATMLSYFISYTLLLC
nr:MAG TPA: hypothetical protein [Caudoviricetes sp.]DAY10241.1 MAG TPA: hypothetical protein [Caudoviricetes sp.]